jgi:translocation and assembly module TamB
MRRLVLVATLVIVGLAGWLTGSESGLRTVAGLAGSFSGGRLQIEVAGGHLLGAFSLGQVRWTDPEQEIGISGLQVDWSPAELLHGRLQIATLSIEQLRITQQPSSTPTPLPSDLRLPLAMAAEKIAISTLHWGEALTVTDLVARLDSDGRRHRIDGWRARTAGIALSGNATLDGAAPFPVDANAQISGLLDQRPLAVALTASGPLERLAVSATATQGVAGHAEIALTPFAQAAFANARLQLDDIDPAAWQPGAPQARLSIVADVQPQGAGIVGSFGLTNHRPGPLDQQRLPLATLAGTLEWQGSVARFASLHAALPGNGELAGHGEWQNGALTLDLAVRRLQAAQIATMLRSPALNGQISSVLGGERQALNVDLSGAGFRLRAEASHAAGRVSLPQLRLESGEARLAAHGEIALDGERRFTAEGELQRFDPSRFGQWPAAQINARLKAAGRLSPQPVAEASFVLQDSRLAGQPLNGEGQLSIAWPRIPRLAIQLAAGANRLSAQGAFGQAGDRLTVDVTAPQLDPYGLEGGLDGHLELSGLSGSPRLAASLNAARLGLPGTVRLSGLSLKAELGGAANSPLALRLDIAVLDTPEQPGLARALQLLGEGSNQAHRLSASAELAGDHRLQLAAEGGLSAERTSWQGKLSEARLNGPDPARHVALAAPAPLQLAATGWSLGPARLAGDPLDWQATVQASADDRQLRATLSARGSRIGRVDGELGAALRSPWSLDRQARWQGRIKAEVADLGWLGEVIGEGWHSEGRGEGELQLTGTPAAPLVSGHFRGDRLALRLPEQGLHLARGELDVDLRDNRLSINRLGFDSPLQPLPRSLRVEARNDLTALTEKPGRLEITGEMRIDRALAGGTTAGDQTSDSAFLDFRLDRLGAFQLPDQWVAVSGNGRLSWQGGTLGARGKLAVDAGYWQLAPGGTPRLSDDVVVKRPGSTKAKTSLRPKLDLDISTDLGRNFLFHGAGLSSRLVGDVRITAQGRDLPRASGTIRTQGGRFDAYGQKLNIERGILSFNGLLDNPGLDVRAMRKGLAVEAGVQIGGTAQKPVVKLVSDPELPDAEKLAWLVLGHGPEQMGAGDATLLFSAAGGLLGNDSGNLVQQLKKTFGFDEFGIRQGAIGDSGGRQATSRVAGGSSVDTTATTGQQILSVGKRLSSNALLSYEQTLGRAEGIVKLTVNLTRQIAVVGRAGSDNALDVFYTMTFGRKPTSAGKPPPPAEAP